VAHQLLALEARGPPEARMNLHAVTLLFHDVAPDGRWELSGFQGADADLYKLDCVDFHRHLTAIGGSLRCPPATGPELLAGPPVEHPFLLTFDDGGVSAALYVADMLDETGWKAHFLVTASRIGAPGFLDRAQIQELRRRGHIIGSHSYSHPLRMAHCPAAQLDDEWRRSVLVLQEILGEPILVASVPGGDYSSQVASAAARAGIKLLFNSEPVTGAQVVDGCLVLGRFTAKRGHEPGWSAAIVGGDRTLQIREYLFWNAKKGAKALLGGAWLRARVLLLERRARKAPGPE
jgi:peptidoglycan/xylan/chitin deacetylase (PgdA/CDA1 family)